MSRISGPRALRQHAQLRRHDVGELSPVVKLTLPWLYAPPPQPGIPARGGFAAAEVASVERPSRRENKSKRRTGMPRILQSPEAGHEQSFAAVSFRQASNRARDLGDVILRPSDCEAQRELCRDDRKFPDDMSADHGPMRR
jgi:hypothetical protein